MWSTEDIAIYDRNGVLQDWAWVRAHYGDVQVLIAPEAEGVLHVVRIVESADGTGLQAKNPMPDAPCAILVKALDALALPLVEYPFVWWWPDAPRLDNPGWGYDRGVIGRTNIDGIVGHSMGPGAAYSPPSGGPHAQWPLGGLGDLVTGLGWLRGTNHYHLDLIYQRQPEEPPDEPPGDDDLLAVARESRDLLREIRDMLEAR